MERQLDIFKVNSYHNSMPLRDEPTLEVYEKKAKTQDEMILEYMRDNKYPSFTPCQVHRGVGQCWPITSVRRSITNLTRDGHLIMTEELRPGLYGHLNHTWKYKV
jgi:hypothetical protein